jgi:uncharacterized protein
LAVRSRPIADTKQKRKSEKAKAIAAMLRVKRRARSKARAKIDRKHQLTLMRSERALTDCRPVSIFSLQSAKQLAEETGTPVDKRRFRANVYVDLVSNQGFAENKFVGRSLRIGPKVVVMILERDARCVMITLDPDTGEKTPAILKKVAQAHEGMAGVYGAVMIEGVLHKGDSVEIID